jgi:hypothetical protein
MDSTLTTNQKGAIAEAELLCAALRLGVRVYKPLVEHGRADLVFEMGNRLIRVQCKWGTLDSGVVRARIGTSRCTPNGYIRTTYDEDEVDAVAIYCAALDKCYLIPIAEIAGQTYIHLRISPSRNNQKIGLRWADDYELGAIAQLGERLAGSQKAAGSSPASSTFLRPRQLSLRTACREATSARG